MWPRAVRSLFVIRAVAAALAFVVCGGAVDWGHLGGDDPDCNLVVVPHDHTAHRFAARRSGVPTPEHCYLCHSLRLLHVGLAALRGYAVTDLQSAQLLDTLDTVAGQRVGSTRSSRAPPVALL